MNISVGTVGCPECKSEMWIPNEDEYNAHILCINEDCKEHLIGTELWKPASQDYRAYDDYTQQIKKHRKRML
jgi:hypothetical protein|tara:strand:- start:142 stop:357 length:216 start_codon:yes stop_codon:yes gene_type:complete